MVSFVLVRVDKRLAIEWWDCTLLEIADSFENQKD